jgi:hypothetical protein
MSEQSTGGAEQMDVCPKCGEPFNHWVDNGFRNTWPKGVDFEVCTTDDSERVFVHTQNLRKNRDIDTGADQMEADRDE